MNEKIASIGLFILSATVACRTRDGLHDRSSVNGISNINTLQKSLLKADIDSANQVHFYIELDGRREPVLRIDETYSHGSVKGVKIDDNSWLIQWLGVTIGEKHGDKTEICGQKFGYSEICDATLFQRSPDNLKSRNLMILGLLDRGVLKMPSRAPQERKNDGLNLTIADSNNIFIDISNHATNEIDQQTTGTCLYNSTTGILEWFRNRASGKIERLSAPYVISQLADTIEAVGEVGAINATETMKRMAPDELLPTQATYDEFRHFYTVQRFAREQTTKITFDQMVPTPRVRATKLFMLMQPAIKQYNPQRATTQHMNSVRDWLISKKTPVHFFHLFMDVDFAWHAVIALGWDEQKQLIKVKDSLGQSGTSGKWRSLTSLQPLVYGAMGTDTLEH